MSISLVEIIKIGPNLLHVFFSTFEIIDVDIHIVVFIRLISINCLTWVMMARYRNECVEGARSFWIPEIWRREWR